MKSRLRRDRLVIVSVCLAVLLSAPDESQAQFTDPCQAVCAATLGASSFVFAMGTMAAIGRLEGGYTTKNRPAITFAGAFLASAGTGMALAGDGDRQRRAIYGSAIGAVGGAALAVAVESLIGEHDTASRWAATLIGGAAGVVVGGIVGATTTDGLPSQGPAFTVVSPPFSLPLLR